MKRRKHDGKRLMNTCYHEAAHAVIAERVGLRVERVEVLGTFRGRTYLQKDKKGRPQKATPLCQAMVYCAGSIAEHVFQGLARNEVTLGDRKLLRLLYPVPNDRAAVMAATEHFVRRYRRSIRRVALELKKRDLTGAQVRRLIFGRATP